MLNLANDAGSEISAQKRYKLQLQAEINKLKEKYSAHLKQPTPPPPPKNSSQVRNVSNEEAIQMLLTPKSNKGEQQSLNQT